jgi:hypothetical protein
MYRISLFNDEYAEQAEAADTAMCMFQCPVCKTVISTALKLTLERKKALSDGKFALRK